jgi:hypothetical protein
VAEDELIDQMTRWGMAKNARRAANDDGPSMGDHILARQRDMALKTKKKREPEREICGRSGEARRRFMAAKISADYEPGTKGARLKMAIVPEWAVDPIRARDDGDRPHDRTPTLIDLVPDELHWIDRALARLERDCRIRALILREEFCGVGTHRMKAARVQAEYGGELTVRQYRYELQRSLDWMRGRMAA